MDRKPLARMERKGERIIFRVTLSQCVQLRTAAVECGEELSRYVRACVFIGHSFRESQRLIKATGA